MFSDQLNQIKVELNNKIIVSSSQFNNCCIKD